MSVQLNGYAPLFLFQMHLTSEQEKIIRSCVSKYSIPDGFCNKLNWAIYRIVNAIKSLFGASDWQKAREAMQAGILERAKNRDLYEPNAQNEREAAINKKVIQVAAKEADELLSHCCDSHADDSAFMLRRYVDLMDTGRLLERIGEARLKASLEIPVR